MTHNFDDIFEISESTTTDADDQIQVDSTNSTVTPSQEIPGKSGAGKQPRSTKPILEIILITGVIFLMVLFGITEYQHDKIEVRHQNYLTQLNNMGGTRTLYSNYSGDAWWESIRESLLSRRTILLFFISILVIILAILTRNKRNNKSVPEPAKYDHTELNEINGDKK